MFDDDFNHKHEDDIKRMPSCGMLCRVALVRIDVSGECIPSIVRVTGISYLGKTLAVISNRSTLRRNTTSLPLLGTAKVVPSSPILVTLMIEAIHSSETSVLTRAAQRNIPDDDIFHNHRREILRPYEGDIILQIIR
jgi:hypothetical protein